MWLVFALLFVVSGIPRFLMLSAHWGSDEARWLNRSSQFMTAVQQGDFPSTLIADHPGVTTMWIAGLRLFFTQPQVDVENLADARWFIGIVVFIGMGIACFLIYRLFGQWVTLASFASLIYSPLFLAQTRRVHTDALAATFILLTVLLFLLYCQNQHLLRYLIFSGITFGLALLSKSYALILLPWVPLCLLVFSENQKKLFSMHFAAGLCFLNCSTLTILVLWPVFWRPIFWGMALCLFGLTFVLFRDMKVERCRIWVMSAASTGLCLVGVYAAETIWRVFKGINWAVTTPHDIEHFFLGKIINNPGWLFYPFVLTIKSTPLMLPLVILGCLLLWKTRKYSEENQQYFRIALALVAGVLLFIVCLSATSKKFPRYLLPAFPMLEILAGIGFIAGLKWGYTALCSRFGTEVTSKYKTPLATLACVGFFLIQVLPVMALHPYYGTYYNLCWKVTDITKIITVGDASGLDIAAEYLNQKPNAQYMQVQVSPIVTQIVRHYFRGYAYPADRSGAGHTPSYEVVYIRDSQIGRAASKEH